MGFLPPGAVINAASRRRERPPLGACSFLRMKHQKKRPDSSNPHEITGFGPGFEAAVGSTLPESLMRYLALLERPSRLESVGRETTGGKTPQQCLVCRLRWGFFSLML
ncbi:unnamed protein product [Merluccius merluccius]